MTKQEEIREGMHLILCDGEPNIIGEPCPHCKHAKELLDYLHSQGVVIKVDRELPTNFYHVAEGGDFEQQAKRREFIAGERMKVCMTNAGYAAVEPLVKE